MQNNNYNAVITIPLWGNIKYNYIDLLRELEEYEAGVSALKATALDATGDILSKPPQYCINRSANVDFP